VSQLHENELIPLNKFSYYFVNSLEFYSLKKDLIPKFSFIVNLLCIFGAFMIPGTLTSWQINTIFFVLFCIIAFSSSMYLYGCVKELRGKEYTLKMCVKRIQRKFILIIFAAFFFTVVSVAGTVLFLLPGIYFMSIYFLYICYIVDLGENFEDSYDASKRLTKPYRETLMKYFLYFILIAGGTGYFFVTLMAASGSKLIVIFAIAFFVAFAVLVYNRFIAYLYLDIEYKKNMIKQKT
jgi:hypothetical protein